MNINLKPSILDNIEIANPCSASWEDMKGNEQVRDCSQCQLSVYNISAMSKKEAETLIRELEGRVCLRLYRRADGTVITENCPVALRKMRDTFRNIARLAASVLSVLLTISITRAGNESAPGGNACEPSNSSLGGKPKGGGQRMGRLIPAKAAKPNSGTTNNSLPTTSAGSTQSKPVQVQQGDPMPKKHLMGKIRVKPKQPQQVHVMQGLPAPPIITTKTGE